MANSTTDLLEIILRDCAAVAPQPWYPAAYVQATGVPRDALENSLDQLRLGGLVRLTDWVKDRGQGYALTPEGEEVLQSPRLLNRLRTGGVPERTAGPATPAPRTAERPTAWNRGEAVRAALLNPAIPWVTLTLVFLNVLVFLYGLALVIQQHLSVDDYIDLTMKARNPQVNEIRDLTGALTPLDVLARGQWWRLLSYCFVHGGLLHIGLNMYFLYAVGPMVERMFGPVRFLALYLIAGLGGGCAVLLAGSAAVGASGALCGILAAMAVWVVLNRPYLPAALASDWLRRIMLNIVLIVIISMLPGVSAAGHFGGGLAGAIVAVPLTFHRYGHGWQRWVSLAGVVAVPAICLGVVAVSVQTQGQERHAETVLRQDIWTVYEQEQKMWGPDGPIKRLVNRTPAERRQDANQAMEAAAAAADLRDRMKHLETMLADAGPLKKTGLAEVVGSAREYAAAGTQFYGTFVRALDPDVTWTRQDEHALQQQRGGLTIARGQLERALVNAGWATPEEQPAGRKRRRPE